MSTAREMDRRVRRAAVRLFELARESSEAEADAERRECSRDAEERERGDRDQMDLCRPWFLR